jgi:hypothetical protein
MFRVVMGEGGGSKHEEKQPCKGMIPRALFLGEMRIILPVSFELRPLE